MPFAAFANPARTFCDHGRPKRIGPPVAHRSHAGTRPGPNPRRAPPADARRRETRRSPAAATLCTLGASRLTHSQQSQGSLCHHPFRFQWPCCLLHHCQGWQGRGVARVAGRQNVATPAGSRVAKKMTGSLFESKNHHSHHNIRLEH